MADNNDDRLRRLEAYEKALTETPAPDVQGAAGGAFLGEKGGTPPDPFEVKRSGGLATAAASIGGEMGGEAAAAELGVGRAGKFGLAVAGATLAATGVKALMSGSDAFDDHGEDLWRTAGETATGTIMGRGVSGMARKSLEGASHIKYFDADVSPEVQQMADDTNKALREYYEKTAGAPISTTRRAWYNPARYFLGDHTELDNTDVVERLRAAGLNPKEARNIAINGGFALGDLSDRSLYRWLQQLSSKSLATSGTMGRFYENRAKMLQGSISDLGEAFGKPLPPEYLAKAINEGLRGRFDTLGLNQRIGLNTLGKALPEDFAFKTDRLRKTLDPNNPADKVLLNSIYKPEIGGGQRTIGFGQYTEARTGIAKLAHDPDSPYRDRAKLLLQRMDNSLVQQLPDAQSRALAKTWRGADDEFNKAGFDKAFIKGLSKNINGRETEVAEQLLKGGNVLNYHRLEAALGEDAPELQALKAGIMERITARATDVNAGGSDRLNPALMRRQLEGKGSVGREYLRAIDPDIAHRYEKFANALDRLNDTSRGSGALSYMVGETQAGGVIGLVYNLTRGNLMQATKIAGALASPTYVAKAMLKPNTASLITRLAGIAEKGQNPGMMARVAGRLFEQLPYEELGPDTSYTNQVMSGKGIIPESSPLAAIDPFRNEPPQQPMMR